MQQERLDMIATASLFSEVSNRMHACLDIPAIMRVSVLAAMELSGARAAAAGLMLDHQLAINEFFSAHSWHPLQCRFGPDEGGIGDLIVKRKPLMFTDLQEQLGFENLGAVSQLMAVPVIDADGELLASLLLFDSERGEFGEDELALISKLASMMAVAINQTIRLTESARVEEDLERSVATYRTLVEQIPAITYIATLERSRILFVSPQVKDILGFHQDEFLANQHIWSERIHPGDRESVIKEVQRSVTERTPFHMEYRMLSKDGTERWVKDAATIVREHDQDIYLQGVVYDITSSKEAEHKLRHMAHFDQLTGLANRTLFHDRLHQTVAHARRNEGKFAVVYLDLDGFKAVNDNLGHKAGDRLLAEVAKRLRSNVRESDTVSRMGGDEFTIILEDLRDEHALAQVAGKLVEAVSQPYDHLEIPYPVTLSMGIALYPEHHTEPDVLVTLADNAMYRAKNSGKNCYRVHEQ